MDIKTIYHGSKVIVKKPDIRRCRPDTDYGAGFYCTEEVELAKEWACGENQSGYANRYELDVSGLSVLDLHSDAYSLLNWLALLVKNRPIRVRTPLQRRAVDYLVGNYLLDVSGYDVITGYRADDSYYDIVRAFVVNMISYEQLSQALKLGNWGYQFVLKSEKAFSEIRFMEAVPASHTDYYTKRKKRDEQAVIAFYQMLEKTEAAGTYMRDLLEASSQ